MYGPLPKNFGFIVNKWSDLSKRGSAISAHSLEHISKNVFKRVVTLSVQLSGRTHLEVTHDKRGAHDVSKEDTMTKISKLSFQGSSQLGTYELAEAAFRAACRPFGSLYPTNLWAAINPYLHAKWEAEVEAAAFEILRAVWAARNTCDQLAGVYLEAFRVELVTPTSGTKISVSGAEGSLSVKILFPGGSTYRAQEILDAANKSGVEFKVEYLDEKSDSKK